MTGVAGSSARAIGRASNGRLIASATTRASATAGACCGLGEPGSGAAERGQRMRANARGELRAHRSGHGERSDKPEQIGVPAMGERHMAQRQQQQHPRQRQPDIGRQAERDQPQQPDFQRLELLEIGPRHSIKDDCNAGIAISRNRLDQAGEAVRASRARRRMARATKRPHRRTSTRARAGQAAASAAR